MAGSSAVSPPRTQSMDMRGYALLRRGRVSLPGQPYLVTFVTMHRRRVFTTFALARVAARCLEMPTLLTDIRMLAWVLMPDHVHCIIALGGNARLDRSVSRLKSGIARRVNRARGSTGALWESGYHDHAIRRHEDLRRAARYLVNNPVRAGLVKSEGDYPYWNTVWT